MHIPKSGGITVERSLQAAFPDARICPKYNVPEYRDYSYSDSDRYDLYLGHFNDDFMRSLPADCMRVLMVRDPLKRLVSQYNHIGTRKAMQAHPHLAQRHEAFASGMMPFAQAIRKLGGFKNLITRFIVGHSRYYEIIKTTPQSDLIGVFDTLVRQRLSRFHVVGLTEDMYSFGTDLSRVVGRDIKITGHHNRNPSSLIEVKDLSEKELRVFARHNAIDLATYALIQRRDFTLARHKTT